MANKAAPVVTIEIGDKPRNLRLDFNALCSIEDAMGVNILEQDVWHRPSAKLIRVFVWACLLHEEPGLKLEDVGSWIHPSNMNDLKVAMEEVWRLSSPEVESNGSVPLPTKAAEK